MKRILIITGEKSGEIIAKPLVLELKSQLKESIHISGMAGDILSPHLDKTIINSSNFGVIGFVEALSKYRVLKLAQNKIFKELKLKNFYSSKASINRVISFYNNSLKKKKSLKELMNTEFKDYEKLSKNN